MAPESEYVRTSSADGGRGFRYETKMTALTAIRLYNITEEFYLASNFQNGGKFDDIVIAAKHASGDWNTWFVQLKHRQVSTLEKRKITVSLLRTGDDFNLIKYFKSYKAIADKFTKSSGKDDPIFSTNLARANFAIYTNATLHSDVLNREHQLLSASFLSTNSKSEYNIKFDRSKDADLFEKVSRDWYLNDYIDKLTFCSGQANEENMDELIQVEIKSRFPTLSPVEVKLVVHEWTSFIQGWITSGRYLVKEEVHTTLNRILMEAQSGKGRPNEISIKFIDTFLDFTRNQLGEDTVLHYISHVDSSIMCLAVLQQIGLLQEPNIHLTLQRLEKPEERQNLLTNWTTRVNSALVVDCEGDTLSVNADSIVNFLTHLIQRTSNRIILVATKDNAVANSISFHIKAKQKKFNCTLKNLDNESKKRLKNREVMFQGYKALLANLMPPSRALDDVFDMAAMTSLLQGRLVSVGIRPVEAVPYYVTRVITRQATVSEHFFDVSACFALSGTTMEQISSNATFAPLIARERLFLMEGDPETEFAALARKTSWPVHWFEKSPKGAKMWRWKKSSKNVVDVAKHVEYLRDFVSTENIMLIEDKVVIITAEPGMGKSTLVDHLAAETKRLCSHLWVISLSLNDYTEELDKVDFVRNVKVYAKELITKAAGVDRETSKFDARLFSQCYETTGNMIVLLDGFDEITPYYTEQGLALVRELQRSAVARVWVTARPVLREQLEAFTSTLSYTIKPFVANDQRIFLKKYWKHKLPSIDEDNLKTFIEQVISLIGKSFDEKLHHFTGIPLQTRMVAEVFQQELETYHETGKLCLNERINGLKLFQEFVRIKQNVQMEKSRGAATSALSRHDQQLLNTARELCLMQLALLTLLPQSECAILQPPLSAQKTQELKEYVTEGNEKTGIILSFRGESPQFIHRTFAEYFVALFFTKNYVTNRKFLSSDTFFSKPFEFVKYFFDRILAAGMAVHEASAERDVEKVFAALKVGGIDAVDAGGRTALHLAASLPGSEALIAALLAAGAQTDVEDAVLAWRPMQYAVAVRSLENIAPLLEHSAGKDTLDKGVVPITWESLLQAVRGDYLQLLLHLLEHGIYAVESLDELSAQRWIDDKVSQGLTILHLAAAHNAAKILTYLLRKDTRDSKHRQIEGLNQEGATALLVAASCGNWAAVKSLMGANANSLAQQKDGRNLSQFAAEAHDLDLLCECLGDANVRGTAPTDFLAGAMTVLAGDKSEQGFSMFDLLLSLYPEVRSIQTTKNTSLLVAAVIKGNDQAVAKLWELGAAVNEETPHGPPLHLAVTGGHEMVVQQLLACPRLRLDACDAEGRTALYKAASRGHSGIFRKLVDAGADCHVTTNDGSDLTHALVTSADLAIFYYLIEKNFNFERPNAAGETAMALLEASKQYPLVKVLNPSFVAPTTASPDKPQPEKPGKVKKVNENNVKYPKPGKKKPTARTESWKSKNQTQEKTGAVVGNAISEMLKNLNLNLGEDATNDLISKISSMTNIKVPVNMGSVNEGPPAPRVAMPPPQHKPPPLMATPAFSNPSSSGFVPNPPYAGFRNAYGNVGFSASAAAPAVERVNQPYTRGEHRPFQQRARGSRPAPQYPQKPKTPGPDWSPPYEDQPFGFGTPQTHPNAQGGPRGGRGRARGNRSTSTHNPQEQPQQHQQQQGGRGQPNRGQSTRGQPRGQVRRGRGQTHGNQPDERNSPQHRQQTPDDRRQQRAHDEEARARARQSQRDKARHREEQETCVLQ